MTYVLVPFKPLKKGLTETYPTLDEARAAAQKLANRTNDWVAVAAKPAGPPIIFVHPSKR